MGKIRSFKIRLIRWWQGVEVGEMPARFGKSKYVNVLKLRGGRIKLVSKEATPSRPKGTLILSAYNKNHGFLVRYLDETGQHRWTSSLNFGKIYDTAAPPTHSNNKRKSR